MKVIMNKKCNAAVACLGGEEIIQVERQMKITSNTIKNENIKFYSILIRKSIMNDG